MSRLQEDLELTIHRHHVQVICEYIENEIPSPVLMPPDACRIWLGRAGCWAGNLLICPTKRLTVVLDISQCLSIYYIYHSYACMYFILDESVGSKYIVFPCLSDILEAEKCVHSLGCYKIIRLYISISSFFSTDPGWWSHHISNTPWNQLGPVRAGGPSSARLQQQRLMGSSSRNIWRWWMKRPTWACSMACTCRTCFRIKDGEGNIDPRIWVDESPL